MEQGAYLEVECSLSVQEILCLLWNPEVNYHVHNSLPWNPIQIQITPTPKMFCWHWIDLSSCFICVSILRYFRNLNTLNRYQCYTIRTCHRTNIYGNCICSAVDGMPWRCMGGGGIAPHIFNLPSWWKLSASCLSLFIPRKGAPATHWIGGWVDSRAGLNAVSKGENPCPFWESDLGLPSHNQVTVPTELPLLMLKR
jgi:hypothetical protein